jgi:hypothetical protein
MMMSLSFLFVAPVFLNKNRLEAAVRWVFIISVVLVIIAFTVVSINRGINRQDLFEVIIISIDWLVLIVNGILLGIVFRRKLKATA